MSDTADGASADGALAGNGAPGTEPLHRKLGLTDDELASIEKILGRAPNDLELAMYSVMWSEHCSYKSSRIHLKRLPTEAPHVLVGPGENAGVIDVGDGIAVALRIESHNHPSAIEPYQGAATGVGGILRDIFTMGARPIALADSLWFGPPDSPRARWITEGVVSGISGYGNSVGVPTVAGEVSFDPCFATNPLVNVMCVGVLPVERLVLGKASGEGNLAVLLGSATGRDGIGGVSVLASAPLEGVDGSSSKRPSVQVGDPYEEKRLIEACLELLDAGLVVGIQDLGGAGLTCATCETAARGGMGMDVDVNAVPRREQGMEPFEVMTSESQERMLAIVEPPSLPRVQEVCARWEITASVAGKVTKGDRLRILDGFDGIVLANVPAASLADEAPLYERPMSEPGWNAAAGAGAGAAAAHLPPPGGCGTDLLALLSDPSLGDKSWVYRQYDHQLFLNTVVPPGGDATVLKLKAPGLFSTGSKGLALSVDGNPRWCALDPRHGTAMVVAESALNVACAGAVPKALVNCLNFGNPEHPPVMRQLSDAIDGMAEACRALKLPVVGGNVSFYNESGGTDIHPTPVVGVVGVIDHLSRRPPGIGLTENSVVLVIGPRPGGSAGEAGGSLGGSRWAAVLHGFTGGTLPPLSLAVHANLLDTVISLVREHLVLAIHDISDGGLGVALAEMAIAGGVGVTVSDIDGREELFSEAPSRVLVGVAPESAEAVERFARDAGLAVRVIGRARGDRIHIAGLVDIPLNSARAAWAETLPTVLCVNP